MTWKWKCYFASIPDGRSWAEGAPWEFGMFEKQRRRWLYAGMAAGMALLAAVVLAALDIRMKRAPHLGFAPSGAQWMVYCPDLPVFWAGLEESDSVQRALAKIPGGRQVFEETVAQTTSIRPAGAWWRLWLGPQTLISEGAGAWGCCVRPGVALRLACWLKEKTGRPARLGRFRYVWREGFLLASESPGYLRLAAKAPAVSALTPPQSSNALKILVRWKDGMEPPRPPQKAELTLWAGPDLHIEGRAMLDAAFSGGGPLILPDAWKTAPILLLSGGSPGDLEALLRWSARTFLGGSTDCPPFPGVYEAAGRLWQTLGTACPGETALWCSGIDFGPALPVPEIGLAVLHPPGLSIAQTLDAFVSAPEAIRYAWDRRDGWQIPLLGAECTLCMTALEPYWLFTSREQAMPGLLDGLQGGRPVDANLALRVDWRQASAALSLGLLRAAQWEILLEKNEDDVRREWLPLCAALGELGSLSVDAQAWGGWVQFKGQLARRTGP